MVLGDTILWNNFTKIFHFTYGGFPNWSITWSKLWNLVEIVKSGKWLLLLPGYLLDNYKQWGFWQSSRLIVIRHCETNLDKSLGIEHLVSILPTHDSQTGALCEGTGLTPQQRVALWVCNALLRDISDGDCHQVISMAIEGRPLRAAPPSVTP